MKRIFPVLFFFAVYQCHGQVDKTSHPDLSGTWTFSSVTSNHKIPGLDIQAQVDREAVLEIVHNDPIMRVAVRQGRNTELVTGGGSVYYTDNRGETNDRMINGESVRIPSKTKWDGKKVVTTVERNSTVFELSADGSQLSFRQNIQTSFDKFYILTVYSRMRSTSTAREPNVSELIEQLDVRDGDTVKRAAAALVKLGPTVLPALIESLKKKRGCVFQFLAGDVVFQIDPDNKIVNQTLFDVSKGKCDGSSEADLVVRRKSAMELGTKPEGIPMILELLSDKDTFNRRTAVFAFDELTERIEDKRPDKIALTTELSTAILKAMPPLIKAMDDKDEIVNCMAYETLEQLQRSIHPELSSEAGKLLKGVKVRCTR